MGIVAKVIVKIVANIAALWIATAYISGFALIGGLPAFIIGGIVLAGINLIIRPILKLISLPLLVLTLGAFYIIIFIIVLLLADALLPQLSVSGFPALLWGALIIGVINTIVH
ncbi:MAG: phage holin family protein [bacterium]|nr:phage holin family protein [bacterium]